MYMTHHLTVPLMTLLMMPSILKLMKGWWWSKVAPDAEWSGCGPGLKTGQDQKQVYEVLCTTGLLLLVLGLNMFYRQSLESRLSLYHSLGPRLAMLLGSYVCKERLLWPEPQTRAGEGYMLASIGDANEEVRLNGMR